MTANPEKIPDQTRTDLAEPSGSTTTPSKSPGKLPGADAKFNGSYVRSIFWIETVLAAVAAALAVVTAVWPTWIELVFAVDPDHRSGSSEWNIVFACAFGAALLAALARRNWRRLLAA